MTDNTKTILGLGALGAVLAWLFYDGEKDSEQKTIDATAEVVDDTKQLGYTDAIDQDAARELELFIENDSRLYEQQHLPIIKNLARKKYKGTYDHAKAVKLYMYLIDNGARKYGQDFLGESGTNFWQGKIPSMFPKKLRLEVAKVFADDFSQKFDDGEYSTYLESQKIFPKKGKKLSGRKKSKKKLSGTKYTGFFFRPPIKDEIGPQSEEISYSVSSKHQAVKSAKLDAKRKNWRYLHVEKS